MSDLQANGVRFNVHQMGQGDPVLVLIHGLVIDNLSSWYFSIAPALATRSSVLMYDLRGHGRSEQPPTGYAIEDMTRDLHSIVREAGLEGRPLVLVGNSTGGLVALRFALDFPAFVQSLVLIDAHTARSDFGELMAGTLELEGAEQRAKLTELLGNWADDHTADGQPNADVEATMRLVRQAKSRRRNPRVSVALGLTTRTSLIRDLRATRAIEDAELRSLAIPVLALYGEHSELRPEGERLAALARRTTLELVPAATHGLIWQATSLLRQRLRAWVDESQLTQ